MSGISVNLSSFSFFALRNGVLNNARDDTLVIDVKIDRIAWGGRSQIAGCRWKRSEWLQPVDLQWTERLYNYFGSNPHPVTVGTEGWSRDSLLQIVIILVFVTGTGLGMKPSRIEKLGIAKPCQTFYSLLNGLERSRTIMMQTWGA